MYDQIEALRRAIEQARELLTQPTPDTFLGQKTYEPFAPEKAASRDGTACSGRSRAVGI
jgi:hypothetical protein